MWPSKEASTASIQDFHALLQQGEIQANARDARSFNHQHSKAADLPWVGSVTVHFGASHSDTASAVAATQQNSSHTAAGEGGRTADDISLNPLDLGWHLQSQGQR